MVIFLWCVRGLILIVLVIVAYDIYQAVPAVSQGVCHAIQLKMYIITAMPWKHTSFKV